MHGPDDHDCDEHSKEGAEGAAVFPLIPPELQINPLLLGLLHAMVFFDGSTDEIIDPDAADEALQYVFTYLNRLKGPALEQVRKDIDRLLAFAQKEGWPKNQLDPLIAFLAEYGIGPA